MSVAINSTRKTVEISWDPSGGVTEPPVEEKPPGYPSHPIFYPDAHPDHELPGDQPKPDQGLPGDQPYPDIGGPGPQPHPEHPIFLPPYIDNSLPQPQPRPDHDLPGRGSAGGEHPDNTLPEFPPDVVEGVDPEVIEKIRAFLEGNLPPFSGGPDYAAPVSADGAVQVFAQGQDGDWSNTAVMPNDGLAALAYPQDFEGESYIEVRALDGTLVDSGTISVS